MGRAKLSPTQVADILVKYSTGKYTQVALAKKYGVTRATIQRKLHAAAQGEDTGRPLDPCGTIGAYRRHLGTEKSHVDRARVPTPRLPDATS